MAKHKSRIPRHLGNSFTHKQKNAIMERCKPRLFHNAYRDYLWTSLKLDKFKLTDSVSEKDSEKSI